eukprot:Filipodium_phascolosomae@DN2310_c0_g1_i3.p2
MTYLLTLIGLLIVLFSLSMSFSAVSQKATLKGSPVTEPEDSTIQDLNPLSVLFEGGCYVSASMLILWIRFSALYVILFVRQILKWQARVLAHGWFQSIQHSVLAFLFDSLPSPGSNLTSGYHTCCL